MGEDFSSRASHHSVPSFPSLSPSVSSPNGVEGHEIGVKVPAPSAEGSRLVENATSPQLISQENLASGASDKVDFFSQHERKQSHWLSGKHLLDEYVNIDLVRKTIAENLSLVVLICVIIIYLIYYFSLISRRPKLIGDRGSKFVKFVAKNFQNDILKHRFNPLIYFWGTNLQTALFGYLLGQLSLDEVPRSKFKRQILYVSDVQYLTSNVDLSQHYSKRRQQIHNKKLATSERLVKLQVNNDLIDDAASEYSLLNRNIQLALGSMLNSDQSEKGGQLERAHATHTHKHELEHEHEHESSHMQQHELREQKHESIQLDLANDEDNLSTYSKRVSTSSDSGVYAPTGSWSSGSKRSSASSSSMSLSSDNRTLAAGCGKCGGLLYGARKHSFDLVHLKQHLPKQRPPDICEELEFGQCALDWYKESHSNYHRNKLVALISGGMTTGSDKKYVTDTVQTLANLGYEVCVFIRRGVDGLKLSSKKFFSPAKWRDFEAAIASIHQQRPDAHLVAIGFSFGSIELCRYLSMSGKRSQISAALLFSCLFDPEAGGRHMRKQLLTRKIDTYLAKQLGKQLHQAITSESQPLQASTLKKVEKQPTEVNTIVNHNGSTVNLACLPKVKSLQDFESNYNRVLQNYPNTEAYGFDCQLHNHLDHIETPTLCVNSEDDFMAPLHLLPLEKICANENLCMILTKKGGHMAFVDGLLWPKKPYFAQRIIKKHMQAVKESLIGDTSQTLVAPPRAQSNKEHHLVQMF